MTEVAREKQVLERARAGDPDARDELVRLHFARIYSLLFRMTGNHEDAEDLAQDSFVRGLQSLDWYRGECTFGTWMYRIALNVSRDHLRAKGRRRPLVTLPPEEQAPAQTGARRPEEEASHRELVAGLHEGLDGLPHRLRAALVLRVFEGEEYAAISEALSITEATARVHVMKARRLLGRRLRPHIGDGGEA